MGFEVLVFGPASPDIEPGRCTYRSILVFRIFFFSVLESPDFESRNLSTIFAQFV